MNAEKLYKVSVRITVDEGVDYSSDRVSEVQITQTLPGIDLATNGGESDLSMFLADCVEDARSRATREITAQARLAEVRRENEEEAEDARLRPV